MRILLAAALVAAFAFLAPAVARDLTLPDPKLTPGAVRELSLREICSTIWSLDRRRVTAAMKRQVFANYGFGGKDDPACKLDKHGRRIEVDHLVPRCAGGRDSVSNLWPQCYAGRHNATMKDRLEVRVCRDLCSGKLSLKDVPAIFSPDWRKSYRRYFSPD